MQAVGSRPVDEAAGQVGGLARVAERDAAFGLDLLQIRPAVGVENEVDAKLARGAAGGLRGIGGLAVLERDVLGVALRLAQGTAIALVAALGFNHADTLEAHEYAVVRGSAGRWPLQLG